MRDAAPRSSRPVAEFRPPQFSETLLGLFVLWCAYLFSNRNCGADNLAGGRGNDYANGGTGNDDCRAEQTANC